MAVKTDIEVIIGGKPLTLSGMESEEYLHKVASYINNKTAELRKSEAFKRQPVDMQGILLALNIADDLFKAKADIASLEDEIDSKEKDLYNIKHELISSQIKLENSDKKVKSLEEKLNDSSKKIMRLEAGLKD